MSNEANQKYGIRIVAGVFATAAMVGAIHALLKGYSEIYTGILLLLAGGFILMALIAAPVNWEKLKNDLQSTSEES